MHIFYYTNIQHQIHIYQVTQPFLLLTTKHIQISVMFSTMFFLDILAANTLLGLHLQTLRNFSNTQRVI